MPVLDIAGLSLLAKKYQMDLRYLPYLILVDQLVNVHKISLLPGVENEDVIRTFLRKGGIAKPLSVGQSVEDSDIGKFEESVLRIENAYASVEDDILNYKEKTIIRAGEQIGINQTKKHPFQVEIMMGIIRTFAEDILDALFNATRNLSDKSPMGLFNGFETKIEAAIATYKIRESYGNIKDSGEFAAPTTGTDITAYIRLRDWLRSANMHLKRNAVLLLTAQVYQNCFDALQNKTAGKAANFADFQSYLNTDAASNISLVKSDIMGSGDRIYLTKPGNMEFGFNSLGDNNFVDVRSINKNPNIINYWIQAGFGTRWISFHEKLFMTNEGTLTANPMSGDYIS